MRGREINLSSLLLIQDIQNDQTMCEVSVILSSTHEINIVMMLLVLYGDIFLDQQHGIYT